MPGRMEGTKTHTHKQKVMMYTYEAYTTVRRFGGTVDVKNSRGGLLAHGVPSKGAGLVLERAFPPLTLP